FINFITFYYILLHSIALYGRFQRSAISSICRSPSSQSAITSPGADQRLPTQDSGLRTPDSRLKTVLDLSDARLIRLLSASWKRDFNSHMQCHLGGCL